MSSWILDMDKADIDYEAERDRRDIERVEEIRRITNGMVFVLKKRQFDYVAEVSVLAVKSVNTQLNTLVRAMYERNFYSNQWEMDYGIDKGEIQIYEDNDGKLIATLPIINIKELHFTMDKLNTIEDILLNYIRELESNGIEYE